MSKSKSREQDPDQTGKPPKKRRSNRGAESRNTILNAAKKLMLEEGYAAVSTRRVARVAGLKPPLVHYYFPTTDDLFLALFRRSADSELEKLDDALHSPQAVMSLWETYCNQDQTTLAIEFMALANHRKAIREEIAALTEQTRRRRAEALAALLDLEGIKPENFSTTGLTVLLIGIARTLVMEGGLGISLGHNEARDFVQWWLGHLAKPL